jgi:hypothetical protein
MVHAIAVRVSRKRRTYALGQAAHGSTASLRILHTIRPGRYTLSAIVGVKGGFVSVSRTAWL